MTGMDLLDPQASTWDLIAVQLRILRVRHGWTCEQVARTANVSRSHVSNWEAGRRRPRRAELVALDEAWSTGGLLATLHGYATDGYDHTRLGAYLDHERKAETIEGFNSDLVFGLFQTEDYMRALFEAGGVVEDVEAEVAKRLERQRILTRPKPPKLWMVLAQPALVWQVGDAAVMRGQHAHLLEISRLPNVSLRVLPVSAGWVSVPGSLSIMNSRDEEVAYFEAGRMGRVYERRPEVQQARVQLNNINARAFPERQSYALIEYTMGLFR
ncbi:XRE family transcriptional regulator [Actinomadura logoneensis]|uniref:XRE family transcriptional regulator n=1 Tax=Actinomadura logoneensis TaxID=2293572 RepID=A0A372JJT9_9ACTN|nr:helix-turn-helix transcriptional regulator [Actinomadura logoneensis]RFU40293.1 XRE family transcriptional regulator [Actinomadura logoneensis]